MNDSYYERCFDNPSLYLKYYYYKINETFKLISLNNHILFKIIFKKINYKLANYFCFIID